MKKIIISIILISAGFTATAQSGYDAVLQQIETNSATLAALRKQTEAQQLGTEQAFFLPIPKLNLTTCGEILQLSAIARILA